MTIVFSYFDIEDAIKFQLLNKNIYNNKAPMMCFQIVGRKIEKEICIYEVYPHARNALSVIIGHMPAPGGTQNIEGAIDAFLGENPLFARKFVYDNFNWPCFENKNLLVAAFKFRSDSYRIRLSADQKFYSR